MGNEYEELFREDKRPINEQLENPDDRKPKKKGDINQRERVEEELKKMKT